MNVKDKTVVITGSSKGLGKELALLLAAKQANLVLLARTKALLEDLGREIYRISGRDPTLIPCDISSESDVEKAVEKIREKHEEIHILVNNAGIATYLVSQKMPNQVMKDHFSVNFFGAYYCIKAMLPLMKHNKPAYILNVGSLFCRVALAETSIYAATKFALAGFSIGLRQELKPYGIRVGLFMPGAIDTPFQENRGEEELQSPKWIMMDPKKVAATMLKMIRRRKKTLLKPIWLLMLLKLKQATQQ